MNRKQFLKSLAAGGAGLAFGSNRSAAAPHPLEDLLPDVSASESLQSWEGIRRLFPLRRDRAYLNTGGLGPPPVAVLDAVARQNRIQAVAGETHHRLLHEVRETTAQFLGAEPSEISFTRNASEGNSIIAAGLDLQPGDEVLFESHAHPGGSMPWMNRQKRDGIRVRIFEPDPDSPEANLERLFSAVTPRTRVIQVSHITAPTGIVFDLPAIAREARERGIWFHVDGAQSPGMIPVNLHRSGCDSFAASGHKWLNGPQETGMLYIAKSRLDEVACSHVGAYSNDDYRLPDVFSYAPTARRHEYGTRNAASVAGLGAAIELQNRIGRKRIAARGRRLAERARRLLSKIDDVAILTPAHESMYAAMLTFRIDSFEAHDLARTLASTHNLRCRAVTERNLNAVRTSWHIYNNQSEVERLAEAVASLTRG